MKRIHPITFGVWRKRYKDRHSSLHYKLKEDHQQYGRYFDKWQKAHPKKIILKKRVLKRQRLIDIETSSNISEYGLKQEPCINFKQHQECKLFRCLVCWLMIHPDDEITEHKDGYAHKICIEGKRAFPRRPSNKERLYEERAECRKCHHSKRAHSVFGYGCFGYSGKNDYGCDCQGWIGYKDKRIV